MFHIYHRMPHQFVDNGDADGGQHEGHVDGDLPEQGFFIQVGCVDEGLQQVDGGNADDGGGELHLQHVGVDVRQPVGLVGVAFQSES